MPNRIRSTIRLLSRRALPILAAISLIALAVLCPAGPVAAQPEAFTVTKTASVTDPVIRGTAIYYTVQFANTGAATTITRIDDTLPAGFQFLSMRAGSDVTSDPNGTTGTISWIGSWPVAAGGTLTLIYNVQVNALPRAAAYLNSVVATWGAGSTTTPAFASVWVTGPYVTVTKLPGAPNVPDRTALNYAITLTNSGTESALIGPITDVLPGHFWFLQMVSGSVGNPQIADQLLTWPGPFNVASGGSLSFTYRVIADGTVGQMYSNQLQATYSRAAGGTWTTDVASAGVLIQTKIDHAYLPIVVKDLNPVPPAPPIVYRVAFDSRPADNREVYTIDADGTNLVNVSTWGDGGDEDPTWSPDGAKIAWVRYIGGKGDIIAANADGTGEVNLTNLDKDDRAPTGRLTAPRSPSTATAAAAGKCTP